MIRNLLVSFVVLFSLVLTGCKSGEKKANPAQRAVFVDSVFTNKFLPKGEGFTGGDGTYSVVLPDGQTLWIFGDTFIGNVTADFHRKATSPAYIRNSFVTFDGDRLVTHQQGGPKEFKSMMIPTEVADGSSKVDESRLWYWPGDGFVENGHLKVFGSKFSQENLEDMWGFKFKETNLMEFTLPDLKPVHVDRWADLDSIHFGHAVCETPDFLYIYGLKGGFPYVARARAGHSAGPWEFYDSKQWVGDAHQARPMLKFVGSEQFSVSEWKGTYVMIMQEGGLGRKIYSFNSKNPYGPWENKKLVYEIPLLANCSNCFFYNALAHPQYTKDNFLLISYNVNSMKLEDHYANALIYRPRFIRVPLEWVVDH